MKVKTISLCALLLCAICQLTSCKCVMTSTGLMTVDPDWQEYCGKLSEEYPATVIEHYTDKLQYVEMDVDGDDTLDLSISMSDAGNEVRFVFPENMKNGVEPYKYLASA